MRLQCTLCLYTAVFAVTVTVWLAMYMYLIIIFIIINNDFHFVDMYIQAVSCMLHLGCMLM